MHLIHYRQSLGKMTNTEETETFCLNFDICNTRTIEEGEIKRKPNLKSFYVKEDQRLKGRECNLKFYSSSW